MSSGNKSKPLKALAYLTQLGLNIVTPLILCILAASWLKARFGFGNKIMLAGVIIGAASGYYTLFKFIKAVNKDERKNEDAE